MAESGFIGFLKGAFMGAVVEGTIKLIDQSSKDKTDNTRSFWEFVAGCGYGFVLAAQSIQQLRNYKTPESIYRKNRLDAESKMPTKTKILASLGVGTIVLVASGVAAGLTMTGAGAPFAVIPIALAAGGVSSLLTYFGISRYSRSTGGWSSNRDDAIAMQLQTYHNDDYMHLMNLLIQGRRVESVSMSSEKMVQFTMELTREEIQIPHKMLPIDRFILLRELIHTREMGMIDLGVFRHFKMGTMEEQRKARIKAETVIAIISNAQDPRNCVGIHHSYFALPNGDHHGLCLDLEKGHHNWWRFRVSDGSSIAIPLKILDLATAQRLVDAVYQCTTIEEKNLNLAKFEQNTEQVLARVPLKRVKGAAALRADAHALAPTVVAPAAAVREVLSPAVAPLLDEDAPPVAAAAALLGEESVVEGRGQRRRFHFPGHLPSLARLRDIERPRLHLPRLPFFGQQRHGYAAVAVEAGGDVALQDR